MPQNRNKFVEKKRGRAAERSVDHFFKTLPFYDMIHWFA